MLFTHKPEAALPSPQAFPLTRGGGPPYVSSCFTDGPLPGVSTLTTFHAVGRYSASAYAVPSVTGFTSTHPRHVGPGMNPKPGRGPRSWSLLSGPASGCTDDAASSPAQAP